MVAPVERLALAPAAASDDHQFGLRALCPSEVDSGRLGLRHNIRSIGDELAINAKNSLKRAFDLGGGVVMRLQSANGSVDQFAQNGNIFRSSEAKVNVRLHHHAKQGPRVGFYRRVMEERDRNEIVHHHGLVCSTISEAASSRKGHG